MNKFIAAFALALFMTVIVTSYSDNVQADLQDNLIRLHVIADSNDENDQAVKLKVRDAVLEEMREKITNENETECKEDIINNLDDIEKIADKVLADNGFTYKSHAMYGKFPFPEKSYKSITLPAGDYYGVRIVLGNGSGHNWWCVMYPPLCFNEGEECALSKESEKILRENLDEDTYDIITQNNGEIKVKFKVVEIVQELKQKISGK